MLSSAKSKVLSSASSLRSYLPNGPSSSLASPSVVRANAFEAETETMQANTEYIMDQARQRLDGMRLEQADRRRAREQIEQLVSEQVAAELHRGSLLVRQSPSFSALHPTEPPSSPAHTALPPPTTLPPAAAFPPPAEPMGTHSGLWDTLAELDECMSRFETSNLPLFTVPSQQQLLLGGEQDGSDGQQSEFGSPGIPREVRSSVPVPMFEPPEAAVSASAVAAAQASAAQSAEAMAQAQAAAAATLAQVARAEKQLLQASRSAEADAAAARASTGLQSPGLRSGLPSAGLAGLQSAGLQSGGPQPAAVRPSAPSVLGAMDMVRSQGEQPADWSDRWGGQRAAAAAIEAEWHPRLRAATHEAAVPDVAPVERTQDPLGATEAQGSRGVAHRRPSPAAALAGDVEARNAVAESSLKSSLDAKPNGASGGARLGVSPTSTNSDTRPDDEPPPRTSPSTTLPPPSRVIPRTPARPTPPAAAAPTPSAARQISIRKLDMSGSSTFSNTQPGPSPQPPGTQPSARAIASDATIAPLRAAEEASGQSYPVATQKVSPRRADLKAPKRAVGEETAEREWLRTAELAAMIGDDSSDDEQLNPDIQCPKSPRGTRRQSFPQSLQSPQCGSIIAARILRAKTATEPASHTERQLSERKATLFHSRP